MENFVYPAEPRLLPHGLFGICSRDGQHALALSMLISGALKSTCSSIAYIFCTCSIKPNEIRRQWPSCKITPLKTSAAMLRNLLL
jgi:hypothetical protein